MSKPGENVIQIPAEEWISRIHFVNDQFSPGPQYTVCLPVESVPHLGRQVVDHVDHVQKILAGIVERKKATVSPEELRRRGIYRSVPPGL